MTAAAQVAPSYPPWHWSRLKLLAKSPAHYLEAAQQETYAMERGTGLHAILLEDRQVIAYPGAARRGKDWEQFEAEHGGAIILTKAEAAKANGMAASVRRNPEAMRLLTGKRETTIEWTFLGHACSSRVDVIGDGFVTELKSTVDASPERFARQAFWMGYLAQLAMYQDAVIQSRLGTPSAAFIVAVESTAPYVVTTFRLSDRALEQGRKVARLWAERALACEAANAFPGYVQSTVDLDVPEDEPELTFGAGEEADADGVIT